MKPLSKEASAALSALQSNDPTAADEARVRKNLERALGIAVPAATLAVVTTAASAQAATSVSGGLSALGFGAKAVVFVMAVGVGAVITTQVASSSSPRAPRAPEVRRASALAVAVPATAGEGAALRQEVVADEGAQRPSEGTSVTAEVTGGEPLAVAEALAPLAGESRAVGVTPSAGEPRVAGVATAGEPRVVGVTTAAEPRGAGGAVAPLAAEPRAVGGAVAPISTRAQREPREVAGPPTPGATSGLPDAKAAAPSEVPAPPLIGAQLSAPPGPAPEPSTGPAATGLTAPAPSAFDLEVETNFPNCDAATERRSASSARKLLSDDRAEEAVGLLGAYQRRCASGRWSDEAWVVRMASLCVLGRRAEVTALLQWFSTEYPERRTAVVTELRSSCPEDVLKRAAE